MDPLADFQGDLDRLADLTDDELRDLEARLVEAFDAADSGGDDAAAGQLADALDTVRGEISTRSEAPPAEPVAAAAEQPAPTSAAPAPSSTQENSPVTASVEVIEPEVPEDRQPVHTRQPSTVVAGANVPGYESGQVIPDLRSLATSMAKRIETIGRVGGADGEQIVVASVRSDIPDDRFLKYGDPIGNREKIDAAINPDAMRAYGEKLEAVTAAGGCCAPLETRYDLWGTGDTDRPVKAGLPGFGADRGGIRFFEGPTLDQLGAAVGFWTCADDAAVDADDPATWKVCARVSCPDESESLVQAVTLCLTFGVMQSRVFPEMVTANNKLALVAQARLSEAALLAQIRAQSKLVSGGTVEAGLGFLRTLLDTVDRAVSYFRDRHRIADSVPLRATFPVWLLGAIDADLIRQPPSTAQMADNFGMSRDQVMSFFRDRNINVGWTLDSHLPGTNGGGFYAALNTGGTIPAFPATMEWSLAIEGSFLFLDGGQLDLGIVRDSTLVRTNDYQTFSETFESVTRVGGEALWVTTPVALTGRFAGPLTYAAV
jgi:hypothetical protein